jgi:hypothetical protein
MVFKLDVLEALFHLCERHAGGAVFWKALLMAVDSKVENSVSEYELYLNYALTFHPDTVKLRHLKFANGPKPGVVYNGGDEGKTSGAVWVHDAHGFEKQMALDQRAGFAYVGYHNYARKRYYDVSPLDMAGYCSTGIPEKNSEVAKKCGVVAPNRSARGGRRLTPMFTGLKSPDPGIFSNCTTPTPVAEGTFDVLYVVHSKDLGPLLWGVKSLLCRVGGIGKVWVVSDDSKTVHDTLESLSKDIGKDRIGWVNEKSYPFSWADVDQYMNCNSNCGWYLQQLLKMYAGRAIPGIRDYLVADADLVWFGRDLSMVAERDPVTKRAVSYNYNTAAQNHRAYFDHMNRLTGGAVTRKFPKISGVAHHMVFKLDVLEALLKLCEKKAGGEVFWKALLKSVDPKAYNSVSEYELYLNYALLHHPTTIKLRHITFANGPRPGLIANGGDEASMRGVWGQTSHGFEKQMALDQRIGYDYVGYHRYATRRYFDAPYDDMRPYCRMHMHNSDVEKTCAKLIPGDI